jgi:hypothetical protein
MADWKSFEEVFTDLKLSLVYCILCFYEPGTFSIRDEL